MHPAKLMLNRIHKPPICRPELDTEPLGQRQIVCIIGGWAIELSCKFHRALVIVQLIIIDDWKMKGGGKRALDGRY
jgi:hypothetical protein